MPFPADGQFGHERGEVDGTHGERIDLTALQELTELLQVGAVGLERIPRQPALELQVGDEVERQLGKPAGGSGSLGGGHELLFGVARATLL